MPSKFRRKIRMPKLYREDELPIDAEDIRKILLSCNNRRLKSYLLALASGAMRASELLATRVKDYDFSVSPTKVHIRKEYSKTGVARDTAYTALLHYLSIEDAFKELMQTIFLGIGVKNMRKILVGSMLHSLCLPMVQFEVAVRTNDAPFLELRLMKM